MGSTSDFVTLDIVTRTTPTQLMRLGELPAVLVFPSRGNEVVIL